jgi:hypothetical protein
MTFAALALTVAACEPETPVAPTPVTTPAPKAQPESDPCLEIAGASFQSVKDLEVGLGPDGVALGRWRVEFHGRNITYDSSDTRKSGTFTCSNGLLSASFEGGQLQGRYDPTTRHLTLGGIEYSRVD